MAGFKTKLTPEEKEQILQWGRENVRIIEITNRLDGKISKQRVEQILKKHGLNPAKVIREKKIEHWNEKMSAKWGVDYLEPASRRDVRYQRMREKFRQKKANTYRHEFTIEFNDLEFPTHCPMLGIELDYFAERTQENSVSFDRIDSSKGYIKGNVIICSWRGNRIKNDGTAEEHKKIYEYLSKFVDTGS
jgi:hypothetical protein